MEIKPAKSVAVREEERRCWMSTPSKLIANLYNAIVDDAAFNVIPALVAKFVGGRASLLQQIGKNRQNIGFQISYYSPGLTTDFADKHSSQLDIWTTAALQKMKFGVARALDEIVPESAFRNSVLWNEVLRPHGDDTGHSVGLLLPFDGIVLGASVHRSFREGAFRAEHAARLDAIGADLARVYKARRLMHDREAKAARLSEMLAASDAKVVLLGLDLRVVEMSAGAQVIVDRCDGLCVRLGRFVIEHAGTADLFRGAVNKTVHREGGEACFFVPRPSGEIPYRLVVLPMVVEGASQCMVLIDDGAPAGNRVQLWLRQCYGVSASEAQVAEALLSGLTPEEIAERRGVSLNTVRTQIKQLMAKTETRRISELVILLAKLP